MALDLPLPILLILLSAPQALLLKALIPEQNLRIPITPIVLGLIAINFGVWAFYRVAIYPFFFSPLRHLPQPKEGAYPIVNHGLVVMKKPPGAEFLKWMKKIPNDGLIMFRGLANIERLLPTDPKYLSEILVHKSYDFEKPGRARRFLRIILGDGLIIVEGDEHRFQRKSLMPFFSYRNIKDLYGLYWSKSSHFLDCLSKEIDENKKGDSTVVEINHWSTKVTLDIIGVAALGRDFNSLENTDDPVVPLYEEILEPTAEKALFFTLHLIGFEKIVRLLPWKINERLDYTTSSLRKLYRKFLADKKEKVKLDTENTQKDILSIMMRSNQFGDDLLIDELLTFLAAGHETTSSAFTWACYLLATNPSMQTKLRQEVQTHLADELANPSDQESMALADKLESLPYLNAVCNEVLRMYPTVPVTIRDAVRNTTIADQYIPKGTQLILSPWAINRSPRLWGPDSEVFKPERWIDANGKANNHGGAGSNYCQLTFLHGPRSCIGQRFAQSELRALLASFVARFEWDMAMPDSEVIPAGVITTKPKNGMKLNIKKVVPVV
ncbi:putative P450 monooxygenase [Phyllosticta capitalensis]|uniref:P450 monooxygenase n=1 Tax=Phyllosticta capitalensis TaxID=121624 RepID=A0ABR1YSJ2_9PEZI